MKIVEKILEALQWRAELTVDLLDAVFSDRGTFYRKNRRFYLQGPKEFKTDWADWYRQRQAFYSLLNRLKRDELVAKKRKGGHTIWRITKKGVGRLIASKARTERRPGGIPMKHYVSKPTSTLLIVAFDIPERQKGKRVWLRENLRALELKMLQKSVWAGRVRVPEGFVRDLRAQEVLPYVHIFSVNKQGTIEQMT